MGSANNIFSITSICMYLMLPFFFFTGWGSFCTLLLMAGTKLFIGSLSRILFTSDVSHNPFLEFSSNTVSRIEGNHDHSLQ